jgi:trans-2,3-dihydro-3-hydroxyanthranilate isomerase
VPEISYLLFDVFAEHPFQGNQLGVVPQHLDDSTMQAIANELNVAETVFLKQTGDPQRPAELRIFTPKDEMRFAGHPTIGATFAIAEVLKWVPPEQQRFLLGELVGDVAVRVERENDKLFAWLRTPPVTFEEQLDRAQCAAAIGVEPSDLLESLPPQLVSAGNPFLYVALKDAQAVDRSWFPLARFEASIEQRITGVFVFCLTENGTYARMFAPMSGVAEDPATGSATGPLFAYLRKYGALNESRSAFISEQGVKLGRRSVLHVRIEREGETAHIDVGGQTVLMGEGRFRF